MKRLLLFVVLSISISVSAYAQQAADVLLQGFYWNVHPGDSARATSQGVLWDSLATVAPQLGQRGIDMVWFPAPSKSFAGVQDMGYGPYDYWDLGELDQKGTVRTRFGTRAELANAITTLRANNVKSMVDMVLGHRAGSDLVPWKVNGGVCTAADAECYQQEHDFDPTPGDNSDNNGFIYFSPASGRFPGDSTHFHPNSEFGHQDLNAPFHNKAFFEDICYFHQANQVLDASMANNGWFFGPHNLGHVGDSLVVWGRWMMQDIGFDAIRLDAVKHIEPGFIAPFVTELVNGTQAFAVGEFFDGNAQAVADWQRAVEAFNGNLGLAQRNANMAVFDFPLRFRLRDIANDASGGVNLWDLNTSGLRFAQGLAPEDIVTFVENHDVDRVGYDFDDGTDPNAFAFGNSFLKFSTASGHDPIFRDKHMVYAYIMAAEGIPMVFWKDYFWYGLQEDLDWMMALRRYTAGGAATPVANLNSFFDAGWHGGDIHVLRRAGDGNTSGALFVMNDRAGGSGSGGVFVDGPVADREFRDYSDAFLFQSTQAFPDGRINVKADSRNYAWYAPTGLYPQSPGTPTSNFMMEAAPGGKLHYIALRAADAANLIVNGAPIQVGDEIAVLGPSGNIPNVAGIGRIGQTVRWDGTHDMLIEVLGNEGTNTAAGRLNAGDALQLVVYSQASGQFYRVDTITYAPASTAFNFSAKRPASRGGSTAFPITTTTASGTYVVGGISQVTALSAGTPLPVELASFDAHLDGTTVQLAWTTRSETNNAGFAIQQATRDGVFTEVGFVAGAGTTIEAQAYTWSVKSLDPGRYQFRLKQLDADGRFSYSPITEVTVGLPQRVVLEPAWPNPFNPSTTLRFAVREAQPVQVILFDALGRRVRTLFDGAVPAGEMQTLRIDGSGLPSGVYFVRLTGAVETAMQRLTLLR